MKFVIENPVFSRGTDNEAKLFLRSALKYQVPFYIRGRFGGKTKMTNKYMSTKGGIFLTGLIPRVQKLLDQRHILSSWDSTEPLAHIPLSDPYLEGIAFKPFQAKLIKDALIERRGVLKAPARSGKTVIMAGIASCFQSTHSDILILMHTKDLLWQTYEEFQKFGYTGFNLGIIGDGNRKWGKVTVALHQSYIKMVKEGIHRQHDLIMIDEAHHVTTDDGNYGKILKNDLAPFRIGVSATPSNEPGARLAMEGLLGPIIGEITQQEAREAEVITQAKVKIVKIPTNVTVKNIRTYYEAYKKGIVLSRTRNRIIMKTAVELIEQNMTVLILVRRVRHGFELASMFEKLSNFEVPFLCGGLDSDTRKEMKRIKKSIEKRSKVQKAAAALKRTTSVTPDIHNMIDELDDYEKLHTRIKLNNQKRPYFRKALDDRTIKCVIVTNIWNEGINIPTLNVLINAAGGKSEIQTIQAASRSLTASSGKEYGLIVDFFDPNAKWFVDHFGHRISLYCEEGWL